MDDENKWISGVEIKAEFWREFSILCNQYIKKLVDLKLDNIDEDMAISMLGDLTSIYGRLTESELNEPNN